MDDGASAMFPGNGKVARTPEKRGGGGKMMSGKRGPGSNCSGTGALTSFSA